MAKLVTNNFNPIGVPTLQGIQIVENDRPGHLGISNMIIPWADCARPTDTCVRTKPGLNDRYPRVIKIKDPRARRMARRLWRRAIRVSLQSGNVISQSFRSRRWFDYLAPALFAALSLALMSFLSELRFVLIEDDQLYLSVEAIPLYIAVFSGMILMFMIIICLLTIGFCRLWPGKHATNVSIDIEKIVAHCDGEPPKTYYWEDVRRFTYQGGIVLSINSADYIRLIADSELTAAIQIIRQIRSRHTRADDKRAIRWVLIRSFIFAGIISTATWYGTTTISPSLPRHICLMITFVVAMMLLMIPFVYLSPWINKKVNYYKRRSEFRRWQRQNRIP